MSQKRVGRIAEVIPLNRLKRAKSYGTNGEMDLDGTTDNP